MNQIAKLRAAGLTQEMFSVCTALGLRLIR